VAEADTVYWHQADNLDWNLGDYVAVDEASSAALGGSAKQKLRLHYSQVFDSTESILDHVVTKVCAGSHIVIMSNGGFDGIHKRLITRLEQL
jgi:UDP-N-acetylmuramate: L-alanyl-gamma-D-glutamyl-meso-diaminopimelate ligase